MGWLVSQAESVTTTEAALVEPLPLQRSGITPVSMKKTAAKGVDSPLQRWDTSPPPMERDEESKEIPSDPGSLSPHGKVFGLSHFK